MTTSTVVRRRLDDARKNEDRLSAQREAAIERLLKLDTKLKLVRKQLARLGRSLTAKVQEELVAQTAPAPLPADTLADIAPVVEAPAVETGIPEFLDRRNLMADPKAKEKNAERRVIEKEKRDAELTGKLKQMPLTGRAALEAIRNG